MGKNKTKGAVPPAPKEEKPNVIEPEVIETKKTRPINVIDADKLADMKPMPGLSPDSMVNVINGLDRHFMQPNAAEKLGLTQETVDKINSFSAHAWVAIAATEAMFGTSQFAQTIRLSQLPGITEAASSMGIVIDQKALPAPNEEGLIQIPSTAIKPSKEAKEALEKEHAILVKKPEVDPNGIKDENGLKDALSFIMADRANTIDKIADSIAFYKSYLKIQAEKSENAEEEKKRIDEMNNVETLNKIRNIVKECPLVLSGIGRSMSTFVGSSKSPVSAFCMLRNSAKNRKTGEYRLTDREIADYTQVLVSWANDLKIADYKKHIENHEKNLKELSKNKKDNAKGIEDVKEKIESCKASIKHLEEVTETIFNASSDFVDALLEKYAEKDRLATTTFKHVLDGYYADVDVEKTPIDTIKHNVKQRAGIITNLFRNPSTPIMEYSEANLVDVTKAKEDDDSKK